MDKTTRILTILGEIFDITVFIADFEHLKVLLQLGRDNVDYFTLVIIMLGINLTLQTLLAVILFCINLNFCKPCSEASQTKWGEIAVFLSVLVAMTDIFIGVFGNRTELLHLI